MADATDVIRPSVLDRLLAGPSGGGSGVHQYATLRELRDAVARDLEWLLNSNRWLPGSLEGFEEVNASPTDCPVRQVAINERTIIEAIGPHFLWGLSLLTTHHERLRDTALREPRQGGVG